ncbi:MAG: AAA family ATPase [Caldilineaceae bacterium]|nr:AAA family ATPase [Caldilineaceae bacterium]
MTRANPYTYTPLLATKLHIPPARARMVARPRLLDDLNGQLEQRLTLISAPAGFGKTTLLSAWLRTIHQPVAWLSLDTGDSDPARFLRYFVAALQQIDAALGQSIAATLDAAQPPLDAAMSALINDMMDLPGDFLLVLDDFHNIDNAVVHGAIQMLVANQPPQMHLVIATREDPPLPLARLRARGQLAEVRAQDLRFTLDETIAFLHDVMGLALAPRDVDALEARIEGWIAGLQLAALSMQKHDQPSEFIAGLSGNHHFILTYLTEEVLRQLPPDLHTFLLHTAVLDQLTGPLCDAVTGREDSAAVLADLYAANVFVIPLDEEHRWYRYHHLFADLLRGQLNRAEPDLAPILHGRASQWYAGEGLAAEAIEHAFAAQNLEEVVRLLEIHARPVVLQGYAQTVEGWLRRLRGAIHSQSAWMAGPRANLAFAWSLLLRGQLGEVEPYLNAAEAASSARASHTEILSLRAALVSLRGDVDKGCDLAEKAVALAPDDPYVQGMSLFSLATAYNYAGRVVEAIEHYQQALPICRASGNTLAAMLIVANLGMLYIMRGQLRAAADLSLSVIAAVERAVGAPTPALATVYGIHSELLYAWGELEAAHTGLQRWLALSKRGGHVAAITYGYVMLSRILLALGDRPGSESALNEAISLLSYRMPAWVTSQVTAQRVAQALDRSDLAAASSILAQTGVTAEDKPHHTREVIQIAYLRLLYHLGRDDPHAPHLAQALDLANRLLDAAEGAGRAGRALEILILRALVHTAQGEDRLALDDLRRALILAAPEGTVTPFANEGAPMQLLLAHLRSWLERRTNIVETRPLLAHIDKVLAAFRDHRESKPSVLQEDKEPSPSSLAEPLSERELDVLRLMGDGLTYQETADQLIVSLNTVRFHVKSIYSKLSVDKRSAAIDRARGLRLI